MYWLGRGRLLYHRHMTNRAFRSWFGRAGRYGLMLGLLACSPAYDWRETGIERGYTALLPARPTVETRTLPLFGQPIVLTLVSAQAQGRLFAVGDARLPAGLAAPERRAAVLQAFADALARNLQGRIVRTTAVGWRGEPGPDLGWEVEVVAAGDDKGGGERRLLARLFVRGDRFYELILIGDTRSMPPDTAETFLNGFRPAR